MLRCWAEARRSATYTHQPNQSSVTSDDVSRASYGGTSHDATGWTCNAAQSRKRQVMAHAVDLAMLEEPSIARSSVQSRRALHQSVPERVKYRPSAPILGCAQCWGTYLDGACGAVAAPAARRPVRAAPRSFIPLWKRQCGCAFDQTP